MEKDKKKATRTKSFSGIVVDGFKVKGKAYKVDAKFTTKNEQLFNNLIILNKIKK